MPDIEKLKQLRDHIAALPEERFDYSKYFTRESDWDAFGIDSPVKYECDTAGCVAGHCCALFDLHGSLCFDEGPVRGNAYVAAANFLKLDVGDDWTLMLHEYRRANRSDALLRLDHLIQHGTLAGYDDSKESWAKREDVE